jgi:hypothetical protein
MFPHVGLLFNRPPGRPGCRSTSHPTVFDDYYIFRGGQCKGLPGPNRTRKSPVIMGITGDGWQHEIVLGRHARLD